MCQAINESQAKINDDNYYVIFGWMINKLQLEGLNLEIFAIIYQQLQAPFIEYYDNIQRLISWTQAKEKDVMQSLRYLVWAGCLSESISNENGIEKHKYSLAIIREKVGD